MQPEIPQTAASDEHEAALPALISPEEAASEDETGHTEGPSAEQLPGVSENVEVAMPHVGPIEASEAEHHERTGLRVMRTSPAALIFCGLVFISLIFLLDFMTQTGTTSAQQSAAANAQGNVEPSPAAAPQQVAQTNTTAPEPAPSVEPVRVETPVQAAPDVPKEDAVEPEKLPAQPAPNPPAAVNQQASDAPQPDASAPPSEEGFTLQIGSYNEQTQAQERVDKLGSFGVKAYVARVEIPKRGTWYRVQTGHFSSREEAARYGTQLRSKGAVADFIVTPSKAA
jgi:cell division septation protein DedD